MTEISRRTLIAGVAGLGGAAALHTPGASALTLPTSAAAAGTAALAWRAFRHDNRRTASVVETVITPATVNRLSSDRVVVPYTQAQGQTIHTPVMNLDTLIWTAKSGYASALPRTAAGSTWTTKTPYNSVDRATVKPALGDGRVLLAGGFDEISMVDLATGALLWHTTVWALDADIVYGLIASPLLFGDFIHLVDLGGHLTTLASDTGKMVWSQPNSAWGTDIMPETHSDPAAWDGKLYVARQNLACFDAATGKVLWVSRIPRDRVKESAVTVADGRVYLAGYNRGVHAFDALTGAHVWTMESGGTNSLAADAGKVYARSAKGLYCLDGATGAVVWQTTEGIGLFHEYRGVTLAGGLAYTVGYLEGYAGKRIFAVDARTGQPLWASETRSSLSGDIIVSNGELYVLTDGGLRRYRLA